ncbi:hypothetical protein PENSTE_c002G08985 [Penicillium steckii]|uniref:tRNA (guanine(9)-N1)-methyltransferase n=1 Tax=Penicillium steckii TaxID=303698 RepID=A0A1V6TST3_9EURO|nr:hypothetical protein PENSTE_c002G08985 [Penicillium steckii]
MSEDERPRKIAKFDNVDETTEKELGPAMTGAVPANNDSEQTGEQIANEPALPMIDMSDDGATEKDGAAEDGPKLSKNQQKKLLRQKKWEGQREARKVKRRELAHKKKDKRQQMIEEARATGGEEAVKAIRRQWEPTKSKFRRSTLMPFSIIIDCGYDDLMISKERISLSSQLTRIYSDNNRAPWRSNLIFSSFNKLLKERFETAVTCHENWKGIKLIPEDFMHATTMAKDFMASPRGGQLTGPFAKYSDAKPEDGEVIYLSSDSENTLTELKPYCTYIIGGLVDKNRHKAVCYKTALEKGVKTAKLPISQYIKMSSRAVLTTNHVVDIMLQWMETGDWGEAFMKVLPQRKGGKLLEKGPLDKEDENIGEVDGAEEEVVEDDKEDMAATEEVIADAGGEAGNDELAS